MKKLLFLALLIGGFALNAPSALAAPGVCQCSDNHTIPNTEQSGCCQACGEYAINQKKEIERASSWKQNVSTGDYTPLACGAIHFCWCAAHASDTNAENKCFIANTSDLTAIATTAACQSVCATPTSNYNTVGRFFESDFKDRNGVNGSTDVCGNYCWCNKPTSDTGTATTCELHRNGPSNGRNIPINSPGECTTTCQALTSPGGTRRGTYGVHETTYVNRTGRADCMVAPGNAPQAPQTPNATAPTVRLFNPLSGASTVVDVINRFIKLLMGLVGAGALAMFIYGGLVWMTAGDDSGRLSTAKTILKNSSLGILLLIFSYSLVVTFFSVFTSTP